MRSNLHAHTVFSDGRDSVDTIIRAAIDREMVSAGISDHAYTPHYELSLRPERRSEYIAAIRAASERYPQIEVYAGMECEYGMPFEHEGLDYIIGSVHYLYDASGEAYCIDFTVKQLERAAAELCGGDYYKLCRLYYEAVGEMARCHRPEILGHFDLITKLNGRGGYFDCQDKRYLSAAYEAVAAAKESGAVIEINTGGMVRGYLSAPYPGRLILEEILSRGIPVMLSSDAHRADNVDAYFDEAAALLRELGFASRCVLLGGHFTHVPV